MNFLENTLSLLGLKDFEVKCQKCGENLNNKIVRVFDYGVYCTDLDCILDLISEKDRVIPGRVYNSRQVQKAIRKKEIIYYR